MKILIVGAGGREHALGWKIKQNPRVKELFFTPGNAGTAQIGTNIQHQNLDGLVDFAKKNSIDLTLIGPEVELAEGVVDLFQAENLAVFGPNKKAAQLEASKAFSKDFMAKYGIQTAAYQNFTDSEKAIAYLQRQAMPIVVKASGLAAGKGVLICQNLREAEAAVKEIMMDNAFGDAGVEVVIEEFLEGFEASILSIFNGKEIVPMLSAKDHKQIGDGDLGLNTGGMGVLAPNPFFTEAHNATFLKDILEPTLKGLIEEELLFSGVIFFGLMITKKGVYLLEYNLRFGDPETQTILPLMKSDLLEVIEKSNAGESFTLDWEDKKACCVVMVSGGYPKAYEKGHKITGLENVNIPWFVAGAEEKDGAMVNTGGRVLNFVAQAESLEKAHELAYQEIQKVSFKDCYYRKDIGK